MDQAATDLSNSSPNYWKISTIVLAILLTVLVARDIWVAVESRNRPVLLPLPQTTSPPFPTPALQSKVTLTGTVKTGGQIDDNSYCAEGLYLVSAEGTYQLRVFREDAGIWNNTALLSDQQYVGKRVRVSGKYPAQEVFCMAAMCACDDYILVDQIYK